MLARVIRLGTDTPIAGRLAIAVLLPILGVIVLAAMSVVELSHLAGRMSRIDELSRFATRISDLVHEAQKERGASAVFLNSKGQQLVVELPAQRKETTARIAIVREVAQSMMLSAYPDEVRRAIEEGLAAIKELDARREDISTQRITGTESNAFFASLKSWA